MALLWKGGKLAKEISEASVHAIDVIMAKCVISAKTDHPFQNRTSILEGSIRMEPARPSLTGGAIGRWGSFTVKYAFWVEVRWGGKYAYLRPAADKHYPELSNTIANLL